MNTMRYLTYFFVLSTLLLSCGTKTEQTQKNDIRFGDYIQSHTRGVISSQDNIQIEFRERVVVPDEISAGDLFNFSPSLTGSLVKTGPRAFTFSPENLKSGTKYSVAVKMTSLMEMPKGLESYAFDFSVIEQDFQVDLGIVQVPDPAKPDQLEFDGSITTADFAKNEDVEKMINFPESLTVVWQHPSSTMHKFAVSGLKRAQQAQTITLTASGSPIQVKKSQDLKLEVPSAEVFSVISTRVDLTNDSYISIHFSDPLDARQDLSGMIQLEGVKKTRTVIDGNEIKLYVREKVSGSKKLEIFEGVKNAAGKTLGQNYASYVAFDPEKPQLRLSNSGTILPSTNGLVLPFEAVNLNAVNVEVIKVFEENMPQFYQINDLNESDELTRVGRQVLTKKIDLSDKAENLSNWNRFTLDLSTLFESERGALYKIRLGFDPQDSNYPCDEALEEINYGPGASWSIYDNDGFNTWGGGFSYRYPPGYEWQQRNNPCHVSYYRTDKYVSTTLLATDLGLIAKIGGNNTMKVFTTNMVTAQPVSAKITILDFQLQELGISSTDENGMATFSPERRPFLVVAEAEGQKSYLKLADNESLSLSNFDVSGTRVRGNIKGFIYGERGVWRPGDDIFLSFMLEDGADQLPADHPVILELSDPRGNIKDKQVITEGVEGLYAFRTKTAKEDETGNWLAKIKVGNNSFSKTVKIETVKPNRLKIDLDFGGDVLTPKERNASGSLSSKWLTGLKAGNLKAEVEMNLRETKTTFKGYAQYDFDDDSKSFYEDPDQVFKGQLDAEGNAQVNLKLPATPRSPGALRAVFNTKVFEPGGGFSINTKAINYMPYTSFVGMNLLTAGRYNRIERNEPQELAVISLDANGQPINRDNLEFKLYKLDWRWWWDQSGNTANYTSSRHSTLIDTKNIKTVDGKGTVKFEIKSPNWGRFIAVVKDPASGHSTSHVFYTSWYGDEGSKIGASSLQVSTNKDEFAAGEKIQVTIRGSYQGQALISVENGSEVLDNFWIKTEKEWTTFELEATPEMAPNVYLHVTLLQPHGQTTNDLPIRLYGLTPINVYDPATKLEPILTMKDELEPESSVDISIAETNGKPMSYTIAMVDEGLLDLTNYKTPNPWNHFYAREAIGVKTWDMYDDVIGAYGGRLERLLSIGGGDGSLDGDKKKDDNRFKPVVQFAGPFYLQAGETKKHTLQIPQYIGSVKTMVVAGLDGAYGNAEKATPVVKPLMVLGTMPRVVGPAEKITMPVNVFRYKDNIQSADITVETTGVLTLAGAKKQTIDLKDESGTLYFDIEVADKIGKGKVVITATSGSEKAIHEINMESRSPNAPQTKVKLITIEPGQSANPKEALFGMEGTNEVTLELATIPPINLEQRIQYLIRYPHGCIEQTVSSVFPQLFLKDITELSVEQQVKVQNNINEAIRKLTKFQTSGGGLSYWPGYDNYNTWGTTYAFHFLIEAQKQGYLVPTDMMNKLKMFQANKARNWTMSVDYYNSDLVQAYRLFTLAISGNAEVGAMNRLRNSTNINAHSIYKLAAAYAIIGQKDAARELMKGRGRSALKQQPYRYYYYNYGSFTRDLAMLLEAYAYMGNQTEAFKILKELSERMSDGRWMSTQTTAYSLLAVSKYIDLTEADKGLSATIKYGNNSTQWTSDKSVYRGDIPSNASGSLSVKNEGQATLFATLTVTGTPPPGKEPAQQENLKTTIKYLTKNGRRLSPDSLKMGESFDIMVTVANDYMYGGVKDIALTQILPSGWEIQNDRLNDNQSSDYSRFSHQDIRDDRVYTYFDLASNSSKTFKLTVTAAYPGKYYLPGVQAEAMYNAEISSKEKGKWVYVVK